MIHSLRIRRTASVAFLFVFAFSLMPWGANASSHREAPLISTDPVADNTDVYAFVSKDKPNTVTLIASFNPFEEPAGGPNFFKFGDNVLYSIHVDNDGDSEPNVTYNFEFKTQIQNPNTFLYNTGPIDSLTDPDFNIRQTYTLTRVTRSAGGAVSSTPFPPQPGFPPFPPGFPFPGGNPFPNQPQTGGSSTVVLGSNLPVPPVNIGPKSTPNYGALSDSAIRTVGTDVKVFAGQTDDAFFVELGGLFDLLTIRQLPGNAGGGVDGLQGYSAQSIALQVPINQLTKNGSTPTSPTDPNAVIGVWSTVSRKATTVLRSNNPASNTADGPWVQVSRLGAPLVNEVVIPLGKKDVWNYSQPRDDAQFANFVTDPELGKLLKALYNVNVPPQGAFGTANQRDDLIAIFLTGIPNLTKPANVKPSEQLRLNVAVAPTQNPNALGVLAGDNQGYPNGRRLADDVTDISIRAVAGAAYPLFHPTFTADPLAGSLGDGVNQNDRAFRGTFPYLALPGSGFDSRPHCSI